MKLTHNSYYDRRIFGNIDYNSNFDLRTFNELQSENLIPEGCLNIDAFHGLIAPRMEAAVKALLDHAPKGRHALGTLPHEVLKECHKNIFSEILPDAGTFDRPLTKAFLNTLKLRLGKGVRPPREDVCDARTSPQVFAEYFVVQIHDQPFGIGSDQVALCVLISQLVISFSEEMARLALKQDINEQIENVRGYGSAEMFGYWLRDVNRQAMAIELEKRQERKEQLELVM